MDARAFLHGPPPGRPAALEWLGAAGKFVAGLALFAAASFALTQAHLPVTTAAWLGMGGFVLALHFGLFHLLSCAWRAAGIDAKPIMRWPAASCGVGEFWGKRWSLAFRDLSHRFVFRPLHHKVGAAPALMAGFLVSGLVHDLVISVPAGAGWGRPTAYFAVSGCAVLLEKSRAGRRIGLGRGPIGWCFTAAVLLLPAAWLFHGPFVHRVAAPFLASIRIW